MTADRVDLLVGDIACLATPVGPAPLLGSRLAELRVIRDAAVGCRDGRICYVGPGSGAPELAPGGVLLDARGGTVLPGFVDPHTHLPWAGDRLGDFERRLEGASYKEILDAGGGIHTTVRATRAATLPELTAACLRRLDRVLACGTTTLEAKSGYGMDRDTERRQLVALRDAAAVHAVSVHATYMGAHVMPAEHAADREGYLRLVVEEMLPELVREGLAEAVDVFCEPGVYDVAESRRILAAARALGLAARIHAEELEALGGAELAAEVGALSADHLVHVSPDGIAAMARAGVSAVLLPATTLFLRGRRFAPARALIDAGVPVALATDLNPGSSHTYAMGMVLSLGCLCLGMTIPEAISACTLQGAYALRCDGLRGSIEPGKAADLLILDVPDHRQLVYDWSVPHVRTVVKDGVVVVDEGRVIRAAA